MLGENIIYLRRERNWTQADLADKLDIARTTLGDYERERTEPGIEMLKQLSGLFDVSIDALLSRNLSAGLELERADRIFDFSSFEADMPGMQYVELVQTKAEAGYLESFQNPEYLRELPRLYIPNLPKNEYRGFEIGGESMLPLESGSIVIGTYVESLDAVRDQRTYVIITKREGVVYKRIRNIPDQKSLLAISDNPVFPPYKIAYEEIAEMWQYHAHVSFSDRYKGGDDRIYERLEDIQEKVNHLYAKYGT